MGIFGDGGRGGVFGFGGETCRTAGAGGVGAGILNAKGGFGAVVDGPASGCFVELLKKFGMVVGVRGTEVSIVGVVEMGGAVGSFGAA